MVRELKNVKKELCELRKYELASMARELKLSGYSKLPKKQLVQLLLKEAKTEILAERLVKQDEKKGGNIQPSKLKSKKKFENWLYIVGSIASIVGIVITIYTSAKYSKVIPTKTGFNIPTDRTVKDENWAKTLEMMNAGKPGEIKNAVVEMEKGSGKKIRELLALRLKKERKEKFELIFIWGKTYLNEKPPDLSSALPHFLHANSILDDNVECKNLISQIYAKQGDRREALKYAGEAAYIEAKESLDLDSIKRLDGIAEDWKEFAEYSKYVDYREKALEVEELRLRLDDQHSTVVSKRLLNLAIECKNIGKYDKALKFIDRGLCFYEEANRDQEDLKNDIKKFGNILNRGWSDVKYWPRERVKELERLRTKFAALP